MPALIGNKGARKAAILLLAGIAGFALYGEMTRKKPPS